MWMIPQNNALRQNQCPFSAGEVWVAFLNKNLCHPVPSLYSTPLIPLHLRHQHSVLPLLEVEAQASQHNIQIRMVLRGTIATSLKFQSLLTWTNYGPMLGTLVPEELMGMLLSVIK